MKFIGRTYELKSLSDIYFSSGYEGVLIYGRRRIGKSELIKQSLLSAGCPTLYYECTRTSEQSNVASFSKLISKTFSIPMPYFSRFTDALEYLFQRSESERMVVVIDEYPYLKETISGCDSLFQRVIDAYSMSCQMKLVLCGSYIDMMEKLKQEDNPLYKRLGFSIHLKQMDYLETSQFYPNYNDEDKVRMYSVFGGLPFYNRFVDDRKSVKDNIISLVASQGARFENDPERNLALEISKMVNANEVLLAIAKGKTKFSDILSSSHVSSSPTLVDTLTKLISLDVIRKEYPINEEKEKRGYYRINDRLSRFYYRYIFPRLSYFSVMSNEAFYDEFIHDDFEMQFVPKEFEEIVKQYLIRQNKEGNISPVLYKVGKYFYNDAKKKQNGEFDVVTEDKLGFTFYEVKFTKEKLGDSVVNEEKEQIKKTGILSPRLGFVSRSGFAISEPENYRLITLKDIYQDS